jgi:autotransporter family porin
MISSNCWAGTIGGQLDLGNGNNTITVTGGSIGNGIVTGTGTDQFTWSGAGTIAGEINLGDGNDIATLRNLTSGIMAPTTLLNSGAGTDALTFDNVETTGVSRFQNWE